MSAAKDYDVIIVGAGMVGATLACALGDSALRIALVENRLPEPPGSDIDLRVSAIGRASQRIFVALGVWNPMTAYRVSPFREMHVWDAAGSGVIHFDSADLGESLLGWIIENRVIQTALLERVRTFANVDLLCPASLDRVSFRESGVHTQLRSGEALHARLLIGADGVNSRVRQWAGIDTLGWGYEQKAVVTHVSTENPHQETAWQRFLSTGPLAFLPLHDGRCSIVWSTASKEADYLLSLDDQAFALQLGKAFEWRLGNIIEVGHRVAFNLRLQHAKSYAKPHVALIGDAAHVVHPLAGQGVNLGLLDAAALAEVLLEAATGHRDIGSLKVLRRYERWRKGENLLMLGLMDGFKRLFGNSLPPVQRLRNIGLKLTDAAGPVKNLLARQAMGLSGDLPRLARTTNR